MSDTPSTRVGRKRGGLGLTLYALAFVCMLIAGGILGFAAKEFFKTTVTLWLSVGFSGLAVVLALASFFTGRRS